MPVTIDTSNVAFPHSGFNSRRLDRCQNGVLWALVPNTTQLEFWYSTDSGSTWTQAAGNEFTAPADASLFIDLDDYAHVAYSVGTGASTSTIKYRRGTPNAGRTSWTWSAEQSIAGGDSVYEWAQPDLVVHRDGSDWDAHIVYSGRRADGGGFAGLVRHQKVDITSAGAFTVGAATSLDSFGLTGHYQPSIDFNHTGDGKTIAGSTPHLYVGWIFPSAFSSQSVRFKKATYSAGSWTWGSIVNIDGVRALVSGGGWVLCMFDGTRVIFPGFLHDGSNWDLILHERDAADTTTTTRVVSDNVALASQMMSGGACYDGDGNVYFLGVNQDEGSGSKDLVRRTWTRSGSSLSGETVIDASSDLANVRARRGYSHAKVEWLYLDGTAQPFPIVYDGVALNAAPNAPVLVAPANASTQDLAAGFTFDWTFSDPNAGDTQSSWAMRRKIVGAPSYEYWNATTGLWQGTEVFNSGVTDGYTFASGKWTNATTYQWSVATKDAAGSTGPYASDFTVTTGSAPTTTATAPSGSVTTTTRPTITWSLSDPEGDPQQTYEVRVESGAYGSTPGSGTNVVQSGEVSSVDARAWTVTLDLTNTVTYRAFVRTKAGGQYSSWAFTTFTLNLTAPSAPSIATSWDEANGRSVIQVTGTHATASFPSTTFRVEASDDNEVTWETIRNGEAAGNGTPGATAVTFYDYEAPLNTDRAYRAITIAEV